MPNDTPAVWQSYIDINNDLKPWLQIDAGVTTNDMKLQLVLDMACTWVQDFLGRPIPPTTFFRRFSGWSNWNGAYISLPYYPVLSVASVVEYWGASGAHTLTEQTPAAQGNSQMYTLDPLKGFVIRSFLGLVARPWFPGLRNIEITWTAGFNPIPPNVKVATLELAAYWWRNTQESPRWYGAAAEQYDASQGSNDLWPAVPNKVTELLEAYTQVGIG